MYSLIDVCVHACVRVCVRACICCVMMELVCVFKAHPETLSDSKMFVNVTHDNVFSYLSLNFYSL